MCLRIFIPTPRRLLLFLIFLVLTVSGAMAIVPPFHSMFGFPYMLLSGYSGIVAQVIYSYIVACIYAAAYVWLEASIRRSYPNMNERVQKHAPPKVEGKRPQTPSGENPLAAPEPPPMQPASKHHRRVQTRIKKAAKRRKR